MLFPNHVILGMHKKYNSNTAQISNVNPHPLNSNVWWAQKVFISIQTGGFLFNCCGASEIQQIGTGFTSEQEKQNFAYMLFNSLERGQTYYFIASSDQLKRSVSFAKSYPLGIVANMLIELGAKEVDASKNRNHGPNNMHLHVWSPSFSDESPWQKYLKFVNPYGDVQPLWWSELTEEAQAKMLEDSKPQMENIRARNQQNVDVLKKQKDLQDKAAAGYLMRNGKLDDMLKEAGWRKDSAE